MWKTSRERRADVLCYHQRIGIWTSALILSGEMESEKMADFFVSPQGRDEWTGKLPEADVSMTDGPFATLVRARDAVRKLKK